MHGPITLTDQFEILRPLGRGSFAHTLLARETALKRQVALKVLHPHTARDWKTYELFEREASVLKDLQHPGIPRIHRALEAEWEGATVAVLVMEYVEGDVLAETIAERRHLEPDAVRMLMNDLLGVLEYLHTRVPPVLHRDIKPANIIVRPGGTPALVDFGSVRNVFRNPDDPGSTVVGTYGYMPYEQTMGQASPSSDLYALAATFLHVLTGRPPADFMGEDGHIEVPATLPGGEPLRGIVARMLAHAPSRRFASAREVRAALLEGSAGTALARAPVAIAALPPAPRALTADLRPLYRKARYSTWQLLNSDGEPGADPTIVDAVLIAAFSILTVGVLPTLLFSRSLARSRRVRQFLRHGTPGVAEVLDMAIEKIEFGVTFTRVRYAFEADGRRRLGADRMLPAVTQQWEIGSRLRILYQPERDYASIILGSV